ncbi:hypothetical protein DEA8626_02338 [Defluviimonas aquaemixtae]|uniref:Uncharacterized protein n=1 Tax=Albidovulum aquaemixtae TaxID=1542388 RepID=A0A2R8B8M2_9RHOB|nr:hypothetical protein [Defluviimonas aquaemixtae]SPH18793.1 hypothetical protein DEA8626_02338 [Defluviimonas aquaemixtae]
MKKLLPLTAAMLAATTGVSVAHGETALEKSPPGEPYGQVSDVLPIPEFVPGLGTLFVYPTILPAGPFLAYDHDGKLSATVYMTPLEDLQKGTAYDGLGVGSHTVSDVEIYYNAGYPGVEKPHARIVLYHDDEAKGRLAE